MRWFWLFILGLGVLTEGLYVQRTRAQAAAAAQLQAALEAERAESPTRRPKRMMTVSFLGYTTGRSARTTLVRYATTAGNAPATHDIATLASTMMR